MSNERKPLLSDGTITEMATPCYDYTLAWLAIDKGRKFYEGLIDKGELSVVNEVEPTDLLSFIAGEKKCGACGERIGNVYAGDFPKFCQHCGTKVKLP